MATTRHISSTHIPQKNASLLHDPKPLDNDSFSWASSYSSSISSSSTLCNDSASIWRAVQHEIELIKPDSPMESQFHTLALRAISLLIEKHETNDQSRVVIAIGGTPGSGKSTLAARVSEILNHAYSAVINHRLDSFYSLPNFSNSTISSDFSSYSYSDNDVDSFHSGLMDNSSPLTSMEAIPIPKQQQQQHNQSRTVAAAVNAAAISSSTDGSSPDVKVACTHNRSKSRSSSGGSTLFSHTTLAKSDGEEGEEQNVCNSSAISAVSAASATSCGNGENDYNDNTDNTLFGDDIDLNAQSYFDLGDTTTQQHDHDNFIGESFTLTTASSDHNNNIHPSSPQTTPAPFAAIVPMDGYHLTRHQLDQFPNPREAHARRGAPWTFDAEGVVSMAQQLHDSTISNHHHNHQHSQHHHTNPKANHHHHNHHHQQQQQPLLFPTFDHAAKDPVPNGVIVAPSTRIVLLEGLYTLLDVNPWSNISRLADMTWCVQVPLDITRLRLARRHLAAGIVSSLQEGFDRVDSNDALNAQYIIDHSVTADCNVPSIQEDSFQ